MPDTIHSEKQRVMALVMLAGKTLLENGAEVFRVQETMTIMAGAYGLTGFHDYVLTNAIFASADGEALSAVRDVARRTLHLGRVEAVNEISREAAAGTLPLDEAETRLAAAAAMPQPGLWAQVAASGVGSLCFAFLFGGTFAEGLMAMLAGAVLGWFLLESEKAGVSNMLRRIVGAAMITVICLGCAAALGGGEPSHAIIGTLMILTPGVAITMGIRDFLRADYLSGTIRLIDALLIAGSIAAGTGLIMGLCGWITGAGL